MSGGGRSALARIWKLSTRSDSSPWRLRMARAVDADQIAEVEREQQLEALRAEHVHARVQLDLAACGRRGPGTPPCRRRAARRCDRRRGGARRFPRRAPGARTGRGSRRSARRRRTSRGTRSGRPRRRRSRLGAALGDQLVQAVPARLARLLRRRALLGSAHRGESLLEADVDLGDLELARGAARHLHGDRLVALAPEQRAARRATRWRACARPAWPRPSRRSCT